jgi:hypothetical protein
VSGRGSSPRLWNLETRLPLGGAAPGPREERLSGDDGRSSKSVSSDPAGESNTLGTTSRGCGDCSVASGWLADMD